MLTFQNKEKSIFDIIDEYIPQEYHLRERIQCAMLFAASTYDASIPMTMLAIEKEREYDYPISTDDENLIDTEVVYYDAMEIAEQINEELYDHKIGENYDIME